MMINSERFSGNSDKIPKVRTAPSATVRNPFVRCMCTCTCAVGFDETSSVHRYGMRYTCYNSRGEAITHNAESRLLR